MSETALLDKQVEAAKIAVQNLTLELTDGCDRCGFTTSYEKTGDGNERITYIYRAQALVAIRLKSGKELRLCGHHFAEHEEALKGVTLALVDKRETANVPAFSGSVYAG